jgi:hypothetical protein
MPRKVLIKIRRGTEVQLPTLDVGELGFCTDTNKLYIGTPTGNQLLVAAQSVGDMLKSIYDTNSDGIVDVAETVIGNEIQLGNYKLIYNETTNSLDIEVVA